MNDARLTIRLPGSSLEFARRYADELGMTVTDLVVRHFERMRAAFSNDGVPESVREVAGLIPESIEVRSTYRDHLIEKYT